MRLDFRQKVRCRVPYVVDSLGPREAPRTVYCTMPCRDVGNPVQLHASRVWPLLQTTSTLSATGAFETDRAVTMIVVVLLCYHIHAGRQAGRIHG